MNQQLEQGELDEILGGKQVSTPPLQSPTDTSPRWVVQSAHYGMFFTKLGALLIWVFTLGLGAPWASCMVINKWCSNVRIDGRRIRFDGTPIELFGIWLKVFVFSILTLTIYYWIWGYKAVAQYIDSHLHWA